MGTDGSTSTRTTKDATHLWLTDEDAHCRLLAEDPSAFVIGFILDQQVTVQKAFRAPADLVERIGTIDPTELAAFDADALEAAFRDKPALHRYPAAMAKRVRQAMQVIVDRYDGDAGRIWWEAADLDDFRARLEEIPGLRGHKWLSMVAVLNQQGGVPLTGWEGDVQAWGTLGDVDSPEALKEYQARKGVAKKAAREATKPKVAAKAKAKAQAKPKGAKAKPKAQAKPKTLGSADAPAKPGAVSKAKAKAKVKAENRAKAGKLKAKPADAAGKPKGTSKPKVAAKPKAAAKPKTPRKRS